MPCQVERKGLGSSDGGGEKQASHVTVAASTAARKTANSFERAAREIIETQPYTAVGVALAIGWLLGRMHRPL